MKVIWNVIETLTPPFDEKTIFDKLYYFADEHCSLLKIKYINRNGETSSKIADIDKPIMVQDQALTFYENKKKRSIKIENLLEIQGTILKNETPQGL